MEINNQALNNYVNAIIILESCVAFQYLINVESCEVEVDLIGEDYKDLPFDLKDKMSPYTLLLDFQVFQNITKIDLTEQIIKSYGKD